MGKIQWGLTGGDLGRKAMDKIYGFLNKSPSGRLPPNGHLVHIIWLILLPFYRWPIPYLIFSNVTLAS